MGLRITTQIGTDKGITSEAYIRISDYQISKSGWANLTLELFQSQDDVPVPGTPFGPIPMFSRNLQIGERLVVPLTKEVEEVVTEKQMVPVEVTEEVTHPGPLDENGFATIVTTTQTRVEMREQDVQVTRTKAVLDLTSVEEANVFAFGYTKLKAKLNELFGADKVVDC